MSNPSHKPALKIDFHTLRTSFRKGDIIFREEDDRDNAYIIEGGMVEISTLRQGERKALVRLGKGEVFGETALLGDGKRSATAVAVEDTEVFLISPDFLRERIMHLDPLVGLLMSLLVSRYQQWRYKAVTGDTEDMPAPQAQKSVDLFMDDLQKQKETALNELRLAQEITQAIDNNQFSAFLQPIVTLPDQKLVGFESLIRWNHPTRGMVSPMEFVPVAERTNVVWDLDMMMLKRACEIVPQLQKMSGQNARKLYVSVNLSGAHFDNPNIAEEIGNILKSSAIDPAQVVFEITESALMGDPKVAEQVLVNVKNLGVRIALDDFGTGYSSLGYLHRFPIDILKIDRSFVQQIESNRKSLDIVRAIVSLAKTFNLSIVGEGIESDNEIFALSGIGCDYGQGYLFSKPMPAEKALEFVQASVEKHG